MNEEKDILIDALQSYMIGKLDPSANFSPQALADALITKVNFNRPIGEAGWSKLNEMRLKLNEAIRLLDDDMKREMRLLQPEEKLLANFVRGKLTAYAEILDVLTKI